MRITPAQHQAIKKIIVEIAGEDASVILFGSRTDDNKRGGDVDLLIELPNIVDNPAWLIARLSTRISQLLNTLGQKQASLIDNLDTAERLEWIISANEWQAIRQLRNQMVHDTIEDLEILVSAIQTAEGFVATLTSTSKKLENELQKRGWLET